MTNSHAIVSPRSRLRRVNNTVMRFLPRGRLMPEHTWRRRHRLIVTLLVLQAIALPLFGWWAGYGLRNSVIESTVVIAAAVGALLPWPNRQIKAAIASLGLLSCAAIFVHFWGGSTAAVFYFFLVVSLLTLYQDWVPFLIAVLYVIAHFGITGSTHPTYVYDHAQAWDNPWQWALLYGGFITAASFASLVAWKANEQLLHDSLTGAASRSLFIDQLERTLRRRQAVAVLFLDLDRFKPMNDRYGHAVGDELLALAASRIRAVLRPQQQLARLGGDEFAVMAPDITSASEARALGDRIRRSVATSARIRGQSIKLSTSVGAALGKRGESADQVIARADASMYQAKRRRRS